MVFGNRDFFVTADRFFAVLDDADGFIAIDGFFAITADPAFLPSRFLRFFLL